MLYRISYGASYVEVGLLQSPDWVQTARFSSQF